MWIKYKVDKGVYPLETTAACAVINNDDLYIFGGNVTTRDDSGIQTSSCCNDFYKLSLISGEWTKIKPKEGELIPTARDKFCGFSTNNGLYFFGGYGPSLKSMPDRSLFIGESSEFYDDDQMNQSWPNKSWNNQLLYYNWDKWQRIVQSGDIPSHRAAASMTFVGKENAVYLFGGRHADTRLNDLYRLDLRTFFWTRIEFDSIVQPPIGRSWATLTYNPDGEYMMLFGGLSSDNMALSDRYKLKIDKDIVHCTNMPSDETKTRIWHATVYVNNAFISYAGMNSSPESDSPCTREMEVIRVSPSSLKQMALQKFVQSIDSKDVSHVLKIRKLMPYTLKGKYLLYEMIMRFKREMMRNESYPAYCNTDKIRKVTNMNLPMLFNAMNI